MKQIGRCGISRTIYNCHSGFVIQYKQSSAFECDLSIKVKCSVSYIYYNRDMGPLLWLAFVINEEEARGANNRAHGLHQVGKQKLWHSEISTKEQKMWASSGNNQLLNGFSFGIHIYCLYCPETIIAYLQSWHSIVEYKRHLFRLNTINKSVFIMHVRLKTTQILILYL